MGEAPLAQENMLLIYNNELSPDLLDNIRKKFPEAELTHFYAKPGEETPRGERMTACILF